MEEGGYCDIADKTQLEDGTWVYGLHEVTLDDVAELALDLWYRNAFGRKYIRDARRDSEGKWHGDAETD